MLIICYKQDEQWRGEALRERLRQQEDHLKVVQSWSFHKVTNFETLTSILSLHVIQVQLRRRMFSQQESLSQRRLQTEGSIQGLRRHVDKLDQLLSNSSKDSYYFNDQEALPKHANVIDQKQCSTDHFVLTWANICVNQAAYIKK